jgi:RND family efflux transporter MFP subunit
LPDIKVDFPDQLDAFNHFFASIDMDNDLPELPEVKNEKLKIYLASRNVFSEYYSIRQDEKKLNRHSLYAPFDGTFIQVNQEVGAFVNVGGQIARMIRTDQLEVEVPVENDQSRWIEIGDVVQVYSRNKTDHRQGVVVRKSNFVDPTYQSRSIFVRVTNSNQHLLLSGEYKEVIFPGQEIMSAMIIPRNAVFNSNEVFTVVDGKLKKREINVIKRDETTMIIDGLEEGTKVVAEPLINVKENSPVGILGEEDPANAVKGKGQGKPKSGARE